MIEAPSSESKLTILQVLPSLVSGGVETGTIDIARALKDHGHRAIVASSGGPMALQLAELGVKHITLPVQSKNPYIMWKNAFRLKKIIRSERVTIVHARSRAPAWSCLWAAKMTHIPFVTTFHGTYGHQNGLKRWYNSIMIRSDITIAVSAFIAQHIKDVYAHTCSRLKPTIQVIHRGIDLIKFDKNTISSSRIDHLRKQWTVPENNTVIMLPGRLTRWKGQSLLIKSIAKVNTDNVTCLLVGDNKGKDHYHKELEALIDDLKLANTVKLVGGCNDMPAAYALADIVVSASTDPEAFGRVACEAQAMGCLVIATKHGGSLETIAPIQQAFMCEHNAIQSLASSLETTLSICQTDKSRITTIALESRKYIEEHFSLNKMCTDTISLYQRLLKRKQAEHDANHQ